MIYWEGIRCNNPVCHWRGRLISFSLTSNSTISICCISFIKQPGCIFRFSVTDPLNSNQAVIKKEVASTHKFVSFPFMHQSPPTESFCHTLVIISIITLLKRLSFTISSKCFVIVVPILYTYILWSLLSCNTKYKLERAQCFPQMERTHFLVMASGISTILLPI